MSLLWPTSVELKTLNHLLKEEYRIWNEKEIKWKWCNSCRVSIGSIYMWSMLLWIQTSHLCHSTGKILSLLKLQENYLKWIFKQLYYQMMVEVKEKNFFLEILLQFENIHHTKFGNSGVHSFDQNKNFSCKNKFVIGVDYWRFINHFIIYDMI